MINLPNEFLKPETRENFYIDATMKTVWAAELEVLNEIAKICERHGLIWFMAFGALLGTVRHQGFIPWDDDIDIWLKRSDYLALLGYLQVELPEGYVVKSPLLESGYSEYQTCVMNSDSISIDPTHLQKFHGCPFIVGIDVFPLDYLSVNGNSEQLRLFTASRQGVMMLKNGENVTKIEAVLQMLEKGCDVTIERTCLENPENHQAKEELIAGLWGLANEIAMSEENDTGQLVMYLDYCKYKKIYESDWFNTVRYLPFEGFDVPIPNQYDKILRVIYGDYMVRMRDSAMHDYPFYKKQVEQLRRRVEKVQVDQRKEGK